MQDLTGFITPLFHFIIALFSASTAGSIPFILTSCLFLTGLLRNKQSSRFTLGQVKEGVQSHVAELASQGTLGSEPKQRPVHYPHENVVFHVAQLQAEARDPQTPKIAKSSHRLMTLAEASETYGIPLGTLYNLLSDGKLKVRGLIFSPAPGGGKKLVDSEEVSSLPRRPRGRPKIKV